MPAQDGITSVTRLLFTSESGCLPVNNEDAAPWKYYLEAAQEGPLCTHLPASVLSPTTV